MAVLRKELESLDFSDIAAPGKLAPTTPGDVLGAEFMAPLGLSAYALGKAIDVPANRITGILHGKRAITADTALRLGRYFGTSAEMWMTLQTNHDLQVARAASEALRHAGEDRAA